MRSASRPLFTAVIGFVLVLALTDELAARAHPLDEDAALALLVRTLKHDKVYARRISLDCVSYDTEETTAAYFQFVLRENHTAPCSGDPETSPVVDRYRVHRASGKIEWLKATDDEWKPYDPAKIR